jgi:predicted ATPase/DNA-binding SARP family transcriptional activator
VIDVLVLGPIEAKVNERIVDLARGRQRLVLAALALAGGDTVSTDRLVDVVWDGLPPENAVATLHVHVSHLRTALRAAGAEEIIVTRSSGYALTDGSVVDAVQFERGAAEGRAALRAGRVAEAAALLTDALALWRGPVLVDIDADFVRPHRARLEELRRVALEERVEAELALGRHVEVAGWLPSLASEIPHHERLHGLLVLALYRAGQQANALRACHALRAALAGDLGLAPSPQSQRLEAEIRAHAPGLDWVAPIEVPPTTLVGRSEELAALTALLAEPGIVTLTGPGGIGKTRLAAEVAPGAPRVELGFIRSRVLATIATALEIAEHPTRTTSESVAAALPPLLVIDNCEHVLSEVREVVAEMVRRAPEVTLLLTSRQALEVAGERVFELPPLDQDVAVELFLERARPIRPAISESRAVAQICRVLDGLPLAIELAAARLDILDPDQIVARLNDSLALLGDALRATLEWGHSLLRPNEQALFRRLAVLPGAWSLEDAEDVVGASVVDALSGLVRASILCVDTTTGSTRFRMGVPVRQLAMELLDASGESDAIHARLLASLLGDSSRCSDDAMRTALDWALVRGRDPAGGIALCEQLVNRWFVRGALSEGLAWCDAAFAADAPSVDTARLHLGAGNLSQAAGDFDAAVRHFGSAAGSDDGAVAARARFGLANLAHLTGRPDAIDQLEASAAQARLLDDDDLLMRCSNGLGVAARRAGDFERARVAGEDALRAARRLGDRISTITALINLGNLLQASGRDHAARGRLEEALRMAREDGFARGIAGSLGSLAALAEDPAQARKYFEESLAVARAAGDRPVVAATMANLGVLQARSADSSAARSTFEEYRALSEQMGDPRGVAFAAQALADLAWRGADPGTASRLVLEALELRVTLGDEDRLDECLELAGLVFASTDASEVATMALASADSSRRRLGVARDDDAEHIWTAATAAAREAVPADRFEAVWLSGAELSPEHAARLVLADR